MASLPRPWWALLTVYVTAQPMAGAFRPKVLYRLGGIALGALVTIALVPNLQNSPALLVLCLASWTGLCIYFAVLDRTPRAFLFQMSAFSAAVISFPYLDDPGNIFDTTIARVQEMTIAILSVTAVHAVLQPWSATPVIRGRAQSFLTHARQWMAEAIGEDHTQLENDHRRRLAADVTELGMLAVHLPFDQRWAPATRQRIAALQQQLARILPLVSAASNRLSLLRNGSALPPALERLLTDITAWLRDRGSRAGRALLWPGAARILPMPPRRSAIGPPCWRPAPASVWPRRSRPWRSAAALPSGSACPAARVMASRPRPSLWRAITPWRRWPDWPRRWRSCSIAVSGSCWPGPMARPRRPLRR
jgi:uncharacterized membrane protein YccC